MSTAASSFIEHRANILAMVEFTSRSDLEVVSFPGDSGLDLIVRVLTGGKEYQKFLGVTLKGTTHLLSTADEATRYLRPFDRKNRTIPRKNSLSRSSRFSTQCQTIEVSIPGLSSQ